MSVIREIGVGVMSGGLPLFGYLGGMVGVEWLVAHPSAARDVGGVLIIGGTAALWMGILWVSAR